MTQKISHIADVRINEIMPGNQSPEEIVSFLWPADPEKIIILQNEFKNLNPSLQYRGKFAILFFQKWLHLLCDEYASPKIHLFNGLNRNSRVRSNEISVGMFASKSELPEKLAAFVMGLPASVAAAIASNGAMETTRVPVSISAPPDGGVSVDQSTP